MSESQEYDNPAFPQITTSEKNPNHIEVKESVLSFSEDENKERGNWTGKFDFLLSCLGYAVGLGNVWRFPYLCYRNGGGAFFIPYCIFLFCCGIPLFLFELTVGQFCSRGLTTCWRYSPIFYGLGAGMMIIAVFGSTYYNVIITWAIWYLFDSFRAKLRWNSCGDWSSSLCSDNLQNITKAACDAIPTLFSDGNGTCYNMTTNKIYGIYNETLAAKVGVRKSTPANDYFNLVSLQLKKSNGFDEIGVPRWDMTLCLLLAWIIVFLAMSKGIKSSGKVVYFTALFPYVVLIILFVNGLLQDGYQDGIKFYLTPKIEKLAEAGVWKDAAVQIFFSLSVSGGGLITLASYNRFHTDVVRDTLIVSFGNCLTSVFAGFVVFSYLGAFAKSIGVSVDKVVDDGVGLAFVVYPQAVTRLPAPPLWSILFFLMLITLGLDSQFATLEAIITGIEDVFPITRKRHKTLLGGICLLLFICSLPMASPGGPYVVTLLDDYVNGWNIMLIALLESVSLAYVYGARRFAVDIETMIGNNACSVIPWRYFKWVWIGCWCGITPIMLAFTMIFSMVKYSPSQYGAYVFPVWVNAIGWVITMIVVAAVFTTAFVVIARTNGSLLQRLKKVITPSALWGPHLVRHRRVVAEYYEKRLGITDFDTNPEGTPDEALEGGQAVEVPQTKTEESTYRINYAADFDGEKWTTAL